MNCMYWGSYTYVTYVRDEETGCGVTLAINLGVPRPSATRLQCAHE